MQEKYITLLRRLKYTWIIIYGCVTALVVLSYWIPPHWMPLLAIALITAVTVFGNHHMGQGNYYCIMFSRSTVYILAISGAIMLGCSLLCTKVVTSYLNWYPIPNPKLPFVAAVIVYPVATIVYGITYLSIQRTKTCQQCSERALNCVRGSLTWNFFGKEMRYFIKQALILSFLLAIVCVSYCLVYYINTNINTPDSFYFFITPAIVYLLSVIYIVFRFDNAHFEYAMTSKKSTLSYYTILRYIVVKEDKVLLVESLDDGSPMPSWDTPAIQRIKYTEMLTDAEIKKHFAEMSGIANFEFRRLFATNTYDHNVFHLAAFIDDDEMSNFKLHGEWQTLYDIDLKLKLAVIARPFAYEINRIYTMTMVWKTYDREGNRLYPIKNYRPTFRLIDFKDWDIDYEDMHWFNVAHNNADRPFFKLRRFWRKNITGTERRWRKND